MLQFRLLVLFFASGLSAECFACLAGYRWNESTCGGGCVDGECSLPQFCSICSAGSISEQGAGECRPCDPGTFSSQPGSIFCRPAPPGWVSFPPFTAPTPCSAGSYQSSDSTCSLCDDGQFSSAGSQKCYDCPAGSYATTPVSGVCEGCGAGTYNSLRRQSSAAACLAVDPGFYAISHAVSPLSCPPSCRCPGGASQPEECPPFFWAAGGATACSPSVWLYVFVPSAVLFGVLVLSVVVLVLRGFFSPHTERRAVAEEDETSKLLKTPEKTVYMGL